MSIALAFARRTADYGETPVGAVVVSPDGKILGHGHNRREGLRDIASHAEIEAMRNAANAVGDWRLTDCSLYVTLEPCPMCAGAIIAARVSRVFYGARDENGGAVSGNLNMFVEFGGGTEVTGGVLADECGAVLSEFFRGMRNPV
ncbi:MAG: nucleoside deaminase [Oscillospiraceae bacterium]|nr:nucleoside deaminase [Oscillospiraceae bacterium]